MEKRGPFMEINPSPKPIHVVRVREVRYSVEVWVVDGAPPESRYRAKPVEVIRIWKGITPLGTPHQFFECTGASADYAVESVRLQVKGWLLAGAEDTYP